MSETRTLTGGCHCGAVRYQVRSDLSRVVACNCSICQKTGSWLTFAPAADFTLVSGEDALSDYQFNKKIIHHLFCKTCGIRSFARGKGPGGQDMVAINVKCLDDVDLSKITPMPYDGKNA